MKKFLVLLTKERMKLGDKWPLSSWGLAFQNIKALGSSFFLCASQKSWSLFVWFALKVKGEEFTSERERKNIVLTVSNFNAWKIRIFYVQT